MEKRNTMVDDAISEKIATEKVSVYHYWIGIYFVQFFKKRMLVFSLQRHQQHFYFQILQLYLQKWNITFENEFTRISKNHKFLNVFNLQDTLSHPCEEFTKGASIKYRTHIFLLEYEYNVFSNIDVGLVTQCSADRATLLEELSKHWPGTISVALYLTDTEVQTFLEFLRGSEELSRRKNIAYHVVYKDGVCKKQCPQLFLKFERNNLKFDFKIKSINDKLMKFKIG